MKKIKRFLGKPKAKTIDYLKWINHPDTVVKINSSREILSITIEGFNPNYQSLK